jgi:membrane-associated phospholipid phosphatase
MDTLIRIIADGLVVAVVVIGGLTYLLSVKKDRLQNYAKAFMAGVTALAIGKLSSMVYDSGARPFIELGVEPRAAYLNNPGFPSDHALFVATITLIVWAATHRSKTSLLLAVLSLLVSVGRVAGLVHSPIDVIGGVAAAFVGVWLWYRSALFKKR